MIQGAIRLGFGQRSSAAAADDPNETGETDAALAVRARVDREAFAALYARYVDPVYRYSLSRLGDREAAEDATSQVFVHALAALPRYREQGSFRSWLFAIAHNVVTDAGRRAGRANSLGGDCLTDDLVDQRPRRKRPSSPLRPRQRCGRSSARCRSISGGSWNSG